MSVGSSTRGPCRYNAFGQLVSRQMTGGVPASTVHMVYDEEGNLLAEAHSVTGETRREYVWLAGRPVAVFDDVDTGNPILRHVHVDHLDRPIMLTSAAKAAVWKATYQPFGEVHGITGTAITTIVPGPLNRFSHVFGPLALLSGDEVSASHPFNFNQL